MRNNNKIAKLIPNKLEVVDFTQQQLTDELNISSQTERIKLPN